MHGLVNYWQSSPLCVTHLRAHGDFAECLEQLLPINSLKKRRFCLVLSSQHLFWVKLLNIRVSLFSSVCIFSKLSVCYTCDCSLIGKILLAVALARRRLFCLCLGLSSIPFVWGNSFKCIGTFIFNIILSYFQIYLHAIPANLWESHRCD